MPAFLCVSMFPLRLPTSGRRRNTHLSQSGAHLFDFLEKSDRICLGGVFAVALHSNPPCDDTTSTTSGEAWRDAERKSLPKCTSVNGMCEERLPKAGPWWTKHRLRFEAGHLQVVCPLSMPLHGPARLQQTDLSADLSRVSSRPRVTAFSGHT